MILTGRDKKARMHRRMSLPQSKVVYSKSHDANLVDYPIRDIDEDESFTELFFEAREQTMTGKGAMFALYNACKYVHEQGISGAFVECGTWAGGSAILAGLTFEKLGADRALWLYDTFDGMTEPTEVDFDRTGAKAATYLEKFSDDVGWCYASLDDVFPNFATAGLTTRNARFVNDDYGNESGLRIATDEYFQTRCAPLLIY
ncbi:MAG: TylF/MycF/NovP-related O-methyltransferase [Pseudomonadota bacterium]